MNNNQEKINTVKEEEQNFTQINMKSNSIKKKNENKNAISENKNEKLENIKVLLIKIYSQLFS